MKRAIRNKLFSLMLARENIVPSKELEKKRFQCEQIDKRIKLLLSVVSDGKRSPINPLSR